VFGPFAGILAVEIRAEFKCSLICWVWTWRVRVFLFVHHKFYHFREFSLKCSDYVLFYFFKIKKRIVLCCKLFRRIRSCPLWLFVYTGALATYWLFVCVYRVYTVLLIFERFFILWIKWSFFFCRSSYFQDFLNLLAISSLRFLSLNWNLKYRFRSSTLLRNILWCGDFNHLGISPSGGNNLFI
jgi:hypothetical protein